MEQSDGYVRRRLSKRELDLEDAILEEKGKRKRERDEEKSKRGLDHLVSKGFVEKNDYKGKAFKWEKNNEEPI